MLTLMTASIKAFDDRIQKYVELSNEELFDSAIKNKVSFLELLNVAIAACASSCSSREEQDAFVRALIARCENYMATHVVINKNKNKKKPKPKEGK